MSLGVGVVVVNGGWWVWILWIYLIRFILFAFRLWFSRCITVQLIRFFNWTEWKNSSLLPLFLVKKSPKISIFTVNLQLFFCPKKHQNLSIFWTFFHFGAISCHFESEKNHKKMTKTVKISNSLFCPKKWEKSVIFYPSVPDFTV